jgi:hypothetical protein
MGRFDKRFVQDSVYVVDSSLMSDKLIQGLREPLNGSRQLRQQHHFPHNDLLTSKAMQPQRIPAAACRPDGCLLKDELQDAIPFKRGHDGSSCNAPNTTTQHQHLSLHLTLGP